MYIECFLDKSGQKQAAKPNVILNKLLLLKNTRTTQSRGQSRVKSALPSVNSLPFPARVRMLNTFEPCTLQLGDMNTYKLRDDDLIMSLDDWKRLEKNAIKTGRRPTTPRAGPASGGGRAAAVGAEPQGAAGKRGGI